MSDGAELVRRARIASENTEGMSYVDQHGETELSGLFAELATFIESRLAWEGANDREDVLRRLRAVLHALYSMTEIDGDAELAAVKAAIDFIERGATSRLPSSPSGGVVPRAFVEAADELYSAFCVRGNRNMARTQRHEEALQEFADISNALGDRAALTAAPAPAPSLRRKGKDESQTALSMGRR